MLNNGVFYAIHLYFGAGILAGDNLIANLYFHGDERAVIVACAGANGYNLCNLGLFLSGSGFFIMTAAFLSAAAEYILRRRANASIQC